MKKVTALVAIAAALAVVAVLAGRSMRPDAPDVAGGRDDIVDASPDAGAAARAEVEGRVWHGSTAVPARVEVRPCPTDLVPPEGEPSPDLDPRWLEIGAPDEPIAVVTAAADGRFSVDGLDPGGYEVLAVAPDGRRTSVLVTLLPGERQGVDLRLPLRVHEIRGRVRWADGRPFGGRLTIAPVDREDSRETVHARAVGALGRVAPDGEGRFTAAVPAGDHVLSALVPGELRVFGPGFRVPTGEEIVLVVDAGLRGLRGRVLREVDGAAVAGASIALDGDLGRLGERILTRTRSGGDGAFRVLVPLADGDEDGASLRVAAPGLASRVARVETAAKDGVIRLRPGARFQGRVLAHPGGTPVVGATVTLTLTADETTLVRRATSGRAAAFAFADLPAGEAEIEVTGAWAHDTERGLNPASWRIAEGGTTTGDVHVVPAAVLRGRVVDQAGGGVAGVRVAAVGGRVETTAVTDAAGNFVLGEIRPGGLHHVRARPAGSCEILEGLHLALPGEVSEIEIRVPEPRWLEALVVEEGSRAPVAGARVRAWQETPLDYPVFGGRTDDDGRALLGPLPPGSLTVYARHPEHLPSERIAAEGGTDECRPPRISFTLVRGAVLAGRVLDAEGRPPRFARVEATRLDDEVRDWRLLDLDPRDAGRFRFADLRPGRYRVDVELWPGPSASVEAATGDEDVRVVLPPEKGDGEEEDAEPGLAVIVTDPSGRPVRDGRVAVMLLRDPAGRRGRIVSGVPIVDGRAHPWWPGRQKEETEPSKERPRFVLVTGAADLAGVLLAPAIRGPLGPDPGDQEIRLDPGRTVTGRVRGPDGRPVAGVRITAWVDHAGLPQYRVGHPPTSTDARGRFRLEGLGAIAYDLMLAVPGAFVRPEPIPLDASRADSGAEMTIGLTAAACPVITVLDGRGRPAARAWVQVDGHRDAMTDALGRVRFVGLDPAKTVRLVVRMADREDVGPLDLEAWRPADTTLRLPRRFVIRGTVVDRESRPVADAHVQVRDVEGRWSEGSRSGEDGAFEVTGLVAGPVRLRAASPGPFDHGPERIADAGETDVVLSVVRGGALVVTARHWPVPLEGVKAAVIDDRGSGRATDWATIGPSGRVAFEGLRGGRTWTVVAGPLPDGRWLIERGLEIGEHEANLAPGRPIRGRVVLPEGTREATVSVPVAHGITATCDVDPDGTFLLPSVPEGTWTVRAEARTDTYAVTGRTTAAAGETVEIRLE